MGDMLGRTVLITLSGLHGAGKTSLSEYIRREFQHRGLECKTVYLGGWHTFEYAKYPLSAALMLLGIDENDERVHSILSKVLPLIFIIQYILYFLYKTRGILFSKRKPLLIIADRYIIDCLVELVILTKNRDFSKTFVGKCLFNFPRAELSLYLDIPESLVFQRKKDECHKLADLSRRRQLYRFFANKQNINTINTNSTSLLNLKNQIVRMIEETLEKKIEQIKC